MITKAWGWMLIAVGVALLTLLCAAWGVVSLVLLVILPAARGRRVGRTAAMLGFRFFLGTMEALGLWRLDLHALDELRAAGPLVIAPNHPSLLDALLVISRLPNAVTVMKVALLGNFLLGPAARLARYVSNDTLLKLVARAGDELALGGQLLLFPEGTRSIARPIGPVTTAVGAVARGAGVAVQTVIIEDPVRFLGKGWPLTQLPEIPLTYRVRLGKRFEPPKDVRAFTDELERYFAGELSANSAGAAAAAERTSGVEGASQLRG